METKYRWAHAGEWLLEKIEEADPITLRQMARLMAMEIDGDTIQGLFEADMDADGFFAEEDDES